LDRLPLAFIVRKQNNLQNNMVFLLHEEKKNKEIANAQLSEAEIEQCKQETDYEPASELLKRITNEKIRIMSEKNAKITKKRAKK
jgi:hypothetical protein